MKKAFALTLITPLLAACSSTWHGVKTDTANTVEKVGTGIEHGWDKTQEAAKKGGNAVGRGISHVGEKIENATAQ